ncbi:Malonyl-CoA decarboxylase, mitochondrial [Galdieria sulphuraria]|nr:Malonyl-CoA decarboxylase, mitochondrial [Galdieria sulphuraria]
MFARLLITDRLWKYSLQNMRRTLYKPQHIYTVVDRYFQLQPTPSFTSFAKQFTTGSFTAPDNICRQYTNCLIDCIHNLQRNQESFHNFVELEKQRQEASKQLLRSFQQLAEEPILMKRFSTELIQLLMKVYSSTSANQYFVIYLAQDLIEIAASLQGSSSSESYLRDNVGWYRNGQSEENEKQFQSLDMRNSINSLQSQSVLPQVLSHMYEVEGALAFLYEIWKDVSLQIKHIGPKDPLLVKLSYFKSVLETEIENQCSPQLVEIVRVLPRSPDHILNCYLEEMSWKGSMKPSSDRQLSLQRLENGHRCYALMHPTEPRKPLAFCQLAFLPFVPSNMNDIMAFAKEPKEESSHSLPVAVIYGIKAISSSFGEGIVTHSRSLMFISWLQDQLYIMDHFSALPNRQRQLVVKWDCLDRLRPVLQLCSGTIPSYIPQTEWMNNITSEIQHHKNDLLSLFAYFVVRGWKFSPFMDPSILFHIRCGAELYQINWMGERTWDALRSCAGITFNFLYNADDMESNLQAYLDRGEVVVSEQVMEHLNRGVVVEKIVDVEK